MSRKLCKCQACVSMATVVGIADVATSYEKCGVCGFRSTPKVQSIATEVIEACGSYYICGYCHDGLMWFLATQLKLCWSASSSESLKVGIAKYLQDRLRRLLYESRFDKILRDNYSRVRFGTVDYSDDELIDADSLHIRIKPKIKPKFEKFRPDLVQNKFQIKKRTKPIQV